MPLQVSKRMTAWWFTPEGFEEDETPPQFYVQGLTGAQKLEVVSDYNPKTEVIGHQGTMAAIKYGLKNWRNIDDEDGKPMKFTLNHVRFLPSEVIQAVALEIIANSNLNEEEDEAKKS